MTIGPAVAVSGDGRDVAAEAKGLTKIYWTATGEVHALQAVDAWFPAKAVTAVVGPSGSGKSSLLRILAGLDRPTAGQVRVGGEELSTIPAGRLRRFRRRVVSYVFQRPSDNLISYLTVEQHMHLAARLRGSPRELAVESRELLETLGIDHRLHHKPHQLSGGEQQRLAFAQAVVGAPALVVADEPTAELDSSTGQALLDTVHQLSGRGIGFVIATHDATAMQAADRTIFLRHGAMEAERHLDERSLSVIDGAGRIQLPPQALRLFPERRAVIDIDDGEIRITPP
ncbi:MAG TPA: ATP-binding cassette domain-containing protein [Actinomycetota bacterium]